MNICIIELRRGNTADLNVDLFTVNIYRYPIANFDPLERTSLEQPATQHDFVVARQKRSVRHAVSDLQGLAKVSRINDIDPSLHLLVIVIS